MMLQYATPATRRPGLVTALAICSIVFGSLGILFNLMAAGVSVWDLTGWSVETPMLPNTSADTTPAGALTEADATIIVEALAAMEPMSEQEQQRLADALVRVESPVAPPLAGVPWSRAHVTPQIVASSSTSPEDAPVEDAETDPGTAEREVHFDFGANGDVWIYDGEIQFWAIRMDGTSVWSDVALDGTLSVEDDRVSTPFAWWLQLWAMLLTELAAIALAVVLLIAGIGTLRERPWAGRLHRSWAWSRILLAVLATGVAAWGVTQIRNDLETAIGEMWGIVAVLGLAFQLVLWLAYPVVVLLVLRARRVREWIDALEPDRAAATGPV